MIYLHLKLYQYDIQSLIQSFLLDGGAIATKRTKYRAATCQEERKAERCQWNDQAHDMGFLNEAYDIFSELL